jgi:hypothetical protein
MLVEEKELAEEGMQEILIYQDGNPKLNIMKVTPTKILLLRFSCSYVGYLLKYSKWTIHVNQDVVKAKMAFLYDHTVIASFVGKLDPLLWHLIHGLQT